MWQFGGLWVATNKSEERLCSTLFSSVLYFRSSLAIAVNRCGSLREIHGVVRAQYAFSLKEVRGARVRRKIYRLNANHEWRMEFYDTENVWEQERTRERQREKARKREREMVVRNANENRTKINGLMMWVVEQYAQWIESLTMDRSQWSAAATPRSARP